MQGLLELLDKPAVQGLLAAGLGAAASSGRGRGFLGNVAHGGLLGLQTYSGAKNNQLELAERAKMGEYRDVQMEKLRADMEIRRQQQAAIDGILNRAGSSQPAAPGQLGSGSFGAVPPASGVPAIPQPQPRIPSLSFDELATLKRYGVDLTDIHKYANEPLKLEAGSTYQNRVTGQREYMPKLPDGMVLNGGRAGFVPGFQESVVGLEGARAQATEGAKAGLDPMQVQAPDGSTRFVPRSVVAGAGQPPAQRPAPTSMRTNPADADRYAILTQELAKARQAGNSQDVAALEAEISRLSPSARTATSPSGIAVAGPFQATPTTAQAAEAAAAKVRAEAEARADVDRQTGRTKKTDQANDMLTNIQRAKTLLEMDPTGSLGGAAVDKVLGAVGMTTPSSNAASALETLSGWMVANVPRMEGPQSNFDVQNYGVMAGKIGDRTVPVKERLAALAEVERIQRKYAHLNGDAPTAPQSEPPKPPPPKPMKGMVRNGYRFKGGDPSKPENWEKQ